MKYKHMVKRGTILVGIVLMLITVVAAYVAILMPTAANFGNMLLLTMVLMQLLTVIVLIHIHDVLTGEYKRGRR